MATTNDSPPTIGTPPHTADGSLMKKTLNGTDTPKRPDIAMATKSVALKVACKDLGKFLNSVPNFQNAHMLRKGREVHKIYVDVHKGSQFLEDEFSITEFGQMVLQNGSQSRVGRAKNAYSIVVARETLYCSGSGMCRRTCGGYGECVVGCTDTKVRGHKCSFRVKLTMRLAHVNYWWVEVQGRHNRPNSEDSDTTKATEEIIANISSTSNTISELLQESSTPNSGANINQLLSSKCYSPSGLQVTSTPNDSITLPHMLDLSEEYSPSQSAFPGLPETSQSRSSPVNRSLLQTHYSRKNSITHTQNILLNIPQTVKTLELQKKLIPGARENSSQFRLPVKIKVEPPDEYLATDPFIMASNQISAGLVNNTMIPNTAAYSLAQTSMARNSPALLNGGVMTSQCTDPDMSSNTTYAVDLTSRDVPNFHGSVSGLSCMMESGNPDYSQPSCSTPPSVPPKESQLAPRSRKRKPLMTTRKVPTIYQTSLESSILSNCPSEITSNENKPNTDNNCLVNNSSERFVDGKDLVSRVKQLETHVQQLRNIVMKGQQSDAASKKKKNQREFDFTKHNTRHVALKIAYLGWDYHGFAVQEDTDKTIETAIFEALTRTKLIECREKSNYHRCGRTDKGVSAFGQVISIDLRTNLSEGVGVKVREDGIASTDQDEKKTEIRYAFILNKVLPPEIRVLAWAPVNESFSARFSCKKRVYKYFFPAAGFDVKVMKEASQKLIGENDYRNFCKMDVANGVVNFTRKILSVDIEVMDERLEEQKNDK